jgi:hypothetical protein
MTTLMDDPAARVLLWAVDPQPPAPLAEPESLLALAVRSEARERAAGQLLSVARADLGLARGEWSDPGAPGGDAFVVAAAIALRRHPALARALLSRARRPRGFADNILRAALVRSVSGVIEDDGLLDDLLAAAPLAGALSAPPAREAETAVGLLLGWAGVPGGRAPLARLLAPPGDRPETRKWRGTVADRIRLYCEGGEALMLDMYEIANVEFGTALSQQTADAIDVLRQADVHGESDLANALALANWWSPLCRLARIDLPLLTARRGLEPKVYRAGFALVGRKQHARSEMML